MAKFMQHELPIYLNGMTTLDAKEFAEKYPINNIKLNPFGYRIVR